MLQCTKVILIIYKSGNNFVCVMEFGALVDVERVV